MSGPAVLLITYNRADITAQVLERLVESRPSRLYVFTDGPNVKKPEDDFRCQAVRDLFSNKDQWGFPVECFFACENLGSRLGVIQAIDWFFTHESEGIILEDDCLIHPSFLRFCETLLVRYREDESIGMISGDNFQQGQQRGDGSYYASQIPNTWGWATWRRAWALLSPTWTLYPTFRNTPAFEAMFETRQIANYWRQQCDMVLNNRLQAWDYQWVFTSYYHQLKSLTPNCNLVSNLGFGPNATHTIQPIKPWYAALPVQDIGVITHPTSLEIDVDADAFTYAQTFFLNRPSSFNQLRLRMNTWFSALSHSVGCL